MEAIFVSITIITYLVFYSLVFHAIRQKMASGKWYIIDCYTLCGYNVGGFVRNFGWCNGVPTETATLNRQVY